MSVVPTLSFARVSALAVLLVLALPPAAAWHLEDEREYERNGAFAGDERVVSDSLGCVEAVQEHLGVSCAVLYAHVFKTLEPFAWNLQRPLDCAPDLARGMTGMPSVEPFWSFTRLFGHPSPGFIERGGDPCAHDNTPFHYPIGARDLRIVPRHPISGVWTLSADTLEFTPAGLGGGGIDLLPESGAMPCVTVRMVLQEGRYPGKGRVVADGATTKTVVSLPAGSGDHDLPLDDPCPGATGTMRAEEATTFHVDLGTVDDVILEETRFILRVEWYQWDSGDPDAPDNAMQREWNMRTGAKHLPRLILPLADALRLDMRLAVFDSMMYLHAGIVSPWGMYDLDTRNVRLDLYDTAGDLVWREQDPIMRMASCYDCFLDPRNISFPLDPFATNLAPGVYTLTISAPNWQHTASAEWSAVLRLEPDGASLESEEGTGLLFLPGPAVATAPATPVLAPFVAMLVALLAVRAGLRRPGP